MRERHLRHGDLLVCQLIDFLGEAVGATNDEDEAFVDGVHLALHPIGKFDRTHLFSVLVE